jgi:lipoic acid synthetase
VRNAKSDVTIEVLTPDFKGQQECLDIVHRAAPDVFNHNIETPRRLTGEIRSGADYDRSLAVLHYVATREPRLVVKSGFMLGLGERDDEIGEMLNDLHDAGVAMVTIGQYLCPGKNNRAVQRFYTPDEFNAIYEQAQEIGFAHVAAGPFVRSSYHAEMNLQKRSEP